jgi:3-oxoadipate enol-lactonase
MLHGADVMTSTGFLEVPNGRLYYEVAGDGPPVLFVHGFSLDTRMWDDQWATFAPRYRVVRVDLRGFGRSEQEPVPYSDLEDLVALLDHLRIERAHIIGLSMGAVVVVDFAIAHPERVASLVAVDGGPGGMGAPPPEMQTITALAADGRMSEALEAWLATALFAPANEQPHVAARLREIVSDYGWWRARHLGLLVGIEPAAAARLDEITAPTLVVVGERERPGVRAGCDALGAGIRGAQMVILPDVGHMSNMEDPAGFNDAVSEFLARHA